MTLAHAAETLDPEALGRGHEVWLMEAAGLHGTGKPDWAGARAGLLDDLKGADGVLSVANRKGAYVYVLLEKGAGRGLARKVAAMDEACEEDGCGWAHTIPAPQDLGSLCRDRPDVVLQLLVNACCADPLDDGGLSALSGEAYLTGPGSFRTRSGKSKAADPRKARVVWAVRATVSPSLSLNLDAVTFTHRSMAPQMAPTRKGAPFEVGPSTPRYKVTASGGIRRCRDRKDRDVFVRRSLRDRKAVVPYFKAVLDPKHPDVRPFYESKCGMAAALLRRVRQRFPGVCDPCLDVRPSADVEDGPSRLSGSALSSTTAASASAADLIGSRLLQVVPADPSDPELSRASGLLARALRSAHPELQVAVLTPGSLDAGAPTAMVVHQPEHYGDGADPYGSLGPSVQHVVAEEVTDLKKAAPMAEKCLAELAVKRDLETGSITFPVPALPDGTSTFVMVDRTEGTRAGIRVLSSSGAMTFEALSDPEVLETLNGPVTDADRAYDARSMTNRRTVDEDTGERLHPTVLYMDIPGVGPCCVYRTDVAAAPDIDLVDLKWRYYDPSHFKARQREVIEHRKKELRASGFDGTEEELEAEATKRRVVVRNFTEVPTRSRDDLRRYAFDILGAHRSVGVEPAEGGLAVGWYVVGEPPEGMKEFSERAAHLMEVYADPSCADAATGAALQMCQVPMIRTARLTTWPWPMKYLRELARRAVRSASSPN